MSSAPNDTVPRKRTCFRSTTFFLLLTLFLVAAPQALFAEAETVDWQNQAAQQRDALRAIIQSWNPLWLFTAMAILPAFGFPLSLFFFAISALPWTVAYTGALSSLAVSMAVGYYTARGIFRPLLTRLLARTRWKIPVTAPGRRLSVIFMVRFCGMPFPLQNWILGLANIPFPVYILWSWLSQVPIAIAFLILGESLWEGKGGLAMLGFMLLIFSFAVITYFRSRQKDKKGEIITTESSEGKA
jgi:uncharacterized membrane protein YdjX (TVP38/TMEM64 family)